jgi:Short C-terminal domain
MSTQQDNQAFVDKYFSYTTKAFYFQIVTLFIGFFTVAKTPAVALFVVILGIAVFAAPRLWARDQKKDPTIAKMIADRKAQGKATLKKLKTLVIANHLAGFEDYGISGSCSLYAGESGLEIIGGNKQKTVIAWTEIQEVDAGSEEDLRKRVTVSRVLLTGIFALALKKEKKKNFYITVSTREAVGLFAINTVGKDNRASEQKAQIFATSCSSRIRAAGGGVQVQEESSPDILSQIEKLGDLLSKGLITQEDFDKSKNDLLRRL